MRINIRLGKKTVIHNSVELCTPKNWRRLSFVFFAKYLPLLCSQRPATLAHANGLDQTNVCLHKPAILAHAASLEAHKQPEPIIEKPSFKVVN